MRLCSSFEQHLPVNVDFWFILTTLCPKAIPRVIKDTCRTTIEKTFIPGQNIPISARFEKWLKMHIEKMGRFYPSNVTINLIEEIVGNCSADHHDDDGQVKAPWIAGRILPSSFTHHIFEIIQVIEHV